jgi:TPR repeat protein
MSRPLPLHTFILLLLLSPPLAAQTAAVRDVASLRAAAEAGSAAAQFDLGTRYLYGDGVAVDNFEAARWFRIAADQDNNNAQYNLGVMYMQGTGVIADFNEALNWFQRAAELGDAPAQFTLATFYVNGRGVPRDPVQAHVWFTLAASAGHQAAAANLVLYQEMMSTEQVNTAREIASQWLIRFNSLHGATPASPNANTVQVPQ